VAARGVFELPGAEVRINEPLARAILDGVPGAEEDTRAHDHEHAIEVELPFLHARRSDVTIVPIVLGGLDAAECTAVGHALAKTLAPGVLVVASSDMNHYLDDAETRRRDRLALDRVLALDTAGLYQTCEREDISMCGVLPATAMLAFAAARGARKAELVGYGTSAEAFGDHDRCVGYAGVIVS
jgi:AmmeMemoRadiSam system protein B